MSGMKVQALINEYINSQPEPKRIDLQELHRIMLEMRPGSILWFLDGKNREGKLVSNTNIGYGLSTIRYADPQIYIYTLAPGPPPGPMRKPSTCN
jgi:hypothetical protein